MMPKESLYMSALPEPLARCPLCGIKPFRSFLRGMVQRYKYTWRTLWLPIGEPRPYCAIICDVCHDIVGYE